MGKSLRKSINEKCKECIYDPFPGNGTWLQQVTNCPAKNCPLYDVRPISSTAVVDSDSNSTDLSTETREIAAEAYRRTGL